MAKIMSRESLAALALSTIANLASFPAMVDLAHKFEHYRRRFRQAMDARNLTNEGMAERMKAHPVTISKLRSGKIKLDDEWRASAASALSIPEELLFGEAPLPAPKPAEMFVSPKKAAKLRRAGNDNIPLYGLAAGSLQGAHSITSDPITEVPCPPALRDVIGAYALETQGESMEPRYFPGDVLYLHPHQRVRAGDHVVIQVMLHDNSGTETWVKRFDSEDADSYHLWQYNPPAKISFKKKYVKHVHRILPTNELFGVK
ncbi:S24 family peptidase [Mesorhizobium sp. B2-1-3A]|uniref:XRE family transcriptional regulator n=1 Tax=Mesorhizobium sp. B2-1-3A TaxID=2589971 RepID=UPI0011278922|nr:S24 family peptidase [Mesorhizobium sp. B2-1-3A]TPM92699.1 helix-turn-helix transcriptional regulator [Mesorhizobium sp. B2-1-3A]